MACPDCNACEPGECWFPDGVMCPYLSGGHDCQHDGPIRTDVVMVDDSVIASTSCVICGHILGTGWSRSRNR